MISSDIYRLKRRRAQIKLLFYVNQLIVVYNILFDISAFVRLLKMRLTNL